MRFRFPSKKRPPFLYNKSEVIVFSIRLRNKTKKVSYICLPFVATNGCIAAKCLGDEQSIWQIKRAEDTPSVISRLARLVQFVYLEAVKWKLLRSF